MRTDNFKIPTENIDYQLWIEQNEQDIYDVKTLEYSPKFSIIVPVYNTKDEILDVCIQSVQNQTYKNWELCLVDDNSSWESVKTCLKKYEDDNRIKIKYRSENGNISVATNDGIHMSTGDYIGFLDCDDLLAPNALYEMAKLLNEHAEYDFIYSDEDKIDEEGKLRTSPFFKPDWSPDLFWTSNYCNHFSIYRRENVIQTGELRTEFNGAQDYDFVFRFLETTSNKKIGHIEKILYHWRESATSTAANKDNKPYVKKVVKKLKEETLQRRNLCGYVEWIEEMKEYRVVFENPEKPLVSIVILSKDHKDILSQCVTSIEQKTKYKNYEIIVVDNGSENKEEIESMLANRAKYIYQPMDFNFSAQCNIGAKAAGGEYILLLNDDVEIIQEDWLDRLVGQASLDYVGAVGAKLYYPDTKLMQHNGVLNIIPGPSHALMQKDDDELFYYGRNKQDYNYLAVTGACILVSKDKYFEVGGLEETLPVAYNDVDFCFKLYEHGYYNVLRNDVVAYHHESLSRGNDALDKKKIVRLKREQEQLYAAHKMKPGEDPFFNRNLYRWYNTNFEINMDRDLAIENRWRLLSSLEGTACIYGMSIDHIECGSVMKIAGWSTSGDYRLDENAKKTLLLKLRDNYIIEIDTFAVERPDVQNAIESKALHTGYIAMVDSSVFKGEERNYTFGIKYELDGEITYSWSAQQLELKDSDSCLGITNLSEIGTESANIICNLDVVSNENNVVYIRGWGFDASDYNHNDYKLKYLVCDTKYGYKKVKVHSKYRADLVAQYMDYAYMVYSGFETVVDSNQMKEYMNGRWYFVIEDMRDHTKIHKELPELSNQL